MGWEHWFYTLPLRFASLFRRRRVERELADELQYHLDRKIEELTAAGLTPEDARREALRSMEGLEQQKELCRDTRRVGVFEDFVKDVHFGLRLLLRSPGFTTVAILTMALGIGANTALFSLVNGVLLSPLPYPDSERLVTIHESKPNFETGSISFPNFIDWQKTNTTFSAMAISRRFSFALTGGGTPEQVTGDFITSDLFPLLGINPVVGRNFRPGEDQVGAAPIAMISEGLWKRRYEKSTDILGKGITLDGKTYSIVGVAPASLNLYARGFRSGDVYVPVGQWNNSLLLSRGAGLGFHGFARLRPGVTLAQARADMARVTHNLADAYPIDNRGVGASLVPFRTEIVGSIQPVLILLMGAVAFVLLVACVNLGNLILVRSSTRQREFAVRNALGASHARLTRQLLTESIMLTVSGGVLGLLLSYWGTRAALVALPIYLPRSSEIRVDGHVLLFTTVITLLAGILAGIAPTLKTARANLRETLQQGGRGTSGLHQRAHRIFVTAEIALALILLIGAGLMTRSLVHLWSIPPGFDSHNLLTFGLTLPPSTPTNNAATIRAAYRELDSRLASTPGVHSSSVAWGAFPFLGDDEWLMWIEGTPKPSSNDNMIMALDYVVSPGYRHMMKIPLRRGRFFTDRDDENAPPVVVIDDSFAAKYFPGKDPVGSYLRMDRETRPIQIIGVVGHVKQWGLDTDEEELQAQIYVPFMQLTESEMRMAGTGINVSVRYEGETSSVLAAIRKTSREMSAEQVLSTPQTLDEVIASSLATRKFIMILLGAFAVSALLLATTGIYGVLSFVVGQRTQEIGIRMALGAQRFDVALMVLRQGAGMTLLGIAAGALAALALTRWMQELLYGIKPTDPGTFAAVSGALALVALIACYIPARRASRVDPMHALRNE